MAEDEECVLRGQTRGAARGRKRAHTLEGGSSGTRKKARIHDMLRSMDVRLAGIEQQLKTLSAMVKKQQKAPDVGSVEVKQEEFALPRSMDSIRF